MYKHDLISLSETYLDFSTPDGLLEIDGYNLVRADHPVRVISLRYLKGALLFEMIYNNKKVIMSVIYRFPTQNNSEFGLFLSNFEKLLSDISKRKSSLFVITCDFNARFFSWWPKDINTTEGLKSFSLTSSTGFPQLINEPTHMQTSSSSCIDLIFTDQPNLSVNSGVHALLNSKKKLKSNCSL